ncbi:MAG: Loki-CTERM sorting domain-containing protein, partial [Lachnospiraceae bacterium]
MSAVSVTYFLMAPECLGAFGIGATVAYPVGIVVALAFLGIFLLATRRQQNVVAAE